MDKELGAPTAIALADIIYGKNVLKGAILRTLLDR